jgi:hypothetical protein
MYPKSGSPAGLKGTFGHISQIIGDVRFCPAPVRILREWTRLQSASDHAPTLRGAVLLTENLHLLSW